MNLSITITILVLTVKSSLGCSYRPATARPPAPETESTTVTAPTSASPQEIRLDFVKWKLLDSLGLSRPPNVSPDRSLSENVLDNLPPLSATSRTSASGEDGVQRSMVITFGDVGSPEVCQNFDRGRNATSVTFKLPVKASVVSKATVWYYAPGSPVSPRGFCSCGPVTESLPNCLNMQVGLESHEGKKLGWKSFNLGFYLQSVASDNRKVRVMLNGPLTEVIGSKRPFLVLELKESDENGGRRKRASGSKECVDAEKSCCCRNSFYVSVRELGWGHWIKDPPGFNFYHCAGQCGEGSDRYNKPGTPDHSLLVDAMSRTMQLGHRACCVASETSPMPIVFYQDNVTINRTFALNFLVQNCGCFGTL